MKYILPELPYDYDELEPYIDTNTMKIHHQKHHQTYINNTNEILKKIPQFSHLSIKDLIKNLENIPEKYQVSLKNNAGGHFNHSFFWRSLKKKTNYNSNFKLVKKIHYFFKDINNFKQTFEKKATSLFGSGWIWLILDDNKKLIISCTSNQDNPLMGKKISGISGYPIFGLDLWEHAYYLKYQNRRIEYVNAFWNILNWEKAEIRFKNHLSS
ncbi:MAG: Fe-Mn family superoxide dismutase [Arsenophonus sp.]|nr:MAG: Fe-Mn family superoxide dismutase [Arsenophonus sp.]